MTVKQPTDEEMGIDAEEHPETGKWRYIWTSSGGAEHIGLFRFDTEQECRRECRRWVRERVAAAKRETGK